MQLGRLWHFCNACHWITISCDTLHNLLWRSDNFTIPTRMIMINNICDNTQQRITIIDQNNQYSYQYNMCAQGTSVYLSTFTLTAIALDRSHHWVLLFCIVVIFVLLLFCIFVIFVFLYFCIFYFLFLICLIFGILLVSQKFMVKIILNQIPDDNSQNSQLFWIKIILTQIPDDHPPVLNSPKPFSHSPHHRRPWLCRHNRHHSVSIWHSFCYFSWKFTFYCFKTVSPQSSPFREYLAFFLLF